MNLPLILFELLLIVVCSFYLGVLHGEQSGITKWKAFLEYLQDKKDGR